jgi:TatA/E family protein of Tat protein translocase
VFSLGGQELFIIVVVVLLLFGPDKIPQLARTVGRFTREFNKYKDIMESTIRMEIANAEPAKADTMTVEERIAKAGAASGALIQGSAADPADEPEADEDVDVAPRPQAVPSADESDEEDEE